MVINSPTYDCPGCHEPILIEDLVATREVECSNCGGRWTVRTQDLPGNRFLLRLTRPDA